jgi:hypothetical protein
MVAAGSNAKMPTPFLWPPLNTAPLVAHSAADAGALLPELLDSLGFSTISLENSASHGGAAGWCEAEATGNVADDEDECGEDGADDGSSDEYISELRARIYQRYVACQQLQAELRRLRGRVNAEDIAIAEKQVKQCSCPENSPTCRRRRGNKTMA